MTKNDLTSLTNYNQPINKPSDLTTAPTSDFKKINGQRVVKTNGAFVWLEYARIKTIDGTEYDIDYSMYTSLVQLAEQDKLPKMIKLPNGNLLSSGQITKITLHQKRWLMEVDKDNKTRLVEP